MWMYKKSPSETVCTSELGETVHVDAYMLQNIYVLEICFNLNNCFKIWILYCAYTWLAPGHLLLYKAISHFYKLYFKSWTLFYNTDTLNTLPTTFVIRTNLVHTFIEVTRGNCSTKAAGKERNKPLSSAWRVNIFYWCVDVFLIVPFPSHKCTKHAIN